MNRETHIVIIGGGIAGLMMGKELLKNGIKDFLILESSPSKEELLKASHIYYLHNRIDELSDELEEKRIITNIFCKGKYYNSTNPYFSNKYAQKISPKTTPTSINHIDGTLKKGWFSKNGSNEEITNHYYEEVAPHILHGSKVVEFNKRLVTTEKGDNVSCDATINTIPLFVMLSFLKIEAPESFEYAPVYIQKSQIKDAQELFQELYLPDSKDPFYRMLVYNNVAIAESTKEDSENFKKEFELKFGLKTEGDVFKQMLWTGRFIPINPEARKSVIRKLTDEFDVFSLGRYGTWSFKRTDHIPQDAKDIIEIMKYKQLIK